VLVLTPTATNVIKDLTAQPEISEGSGLRIAPAPDGSGELQLSLQAEPNPGDEVIANEGARVFLEPATANLLADQALEARITEGGAGFYLTRQNPTEA
jgi:iron-sulfur cluster assembly protein